MFVFEGTAAKLSGVSRVADVAKLQLRKAEQQMRQAPGFKLASGAASTNSAASSALQAVHKVRSRQAVGTSGAGPVEQGGAPPQVTHKPSRKAKTKRPRHEAKQDATSYKTKSVAGDGKWQGVTRASARQKGGSAGGGAGGPPGHPVGWQPRPMQAPCQLQPVQVCADHLLASRQQHIQQAVKGSSTHKQQRSSGGSGEGHTWHTSTAHGQQVRGRPEQPLPSPLPSQPSGSQVTGDDKPVTIPVGKRLIKRKAGDTRESDGDYNVVESQEDPEESTPQGRRQHLPPCTGRHNSHAPATLPGHSGAARRMPILFPRYMVAFVALLPSWDTVVTL